MALLASFGLGLSLFVVNKFILPTDQVRPARHGVRRETSVPVVTPDQVTLLADIFHPKGLQRTPTILVRIPFSDTWANRIRSFLIGRFWASRGYTVVIQGTRGRYRSGGSFYPLRHEREDGIATLKWLQTQPWFDGRIAMWGGSAFGHTQWVLADQREPGPQALFIQIASSRFQEMFYQGHAFSLESALFWALRSHGEEDREVDSADLDRGSRQWPIMEAAKAAGGDADFFQDWLLNQDDDRKWAPVDAARGPETLQAPVLLMGGWYDPFLPAQLGDFARVLAQARAPVAAETRLIIGPWAHARTVALAGTRLAGPYRQASLAPSLAWFDHQLGVTNAPLDMPRVKIFVMGENRWREEREWPLARTRFTPFYLGSAGHANTLAGDGCLTLEPPLAQADLDRFTYDPRQPVPSAGGAMLGERSGIRLQNAVEARQDVLVYSTMPLTRRLEVTGPVSLTLYVQTDAVATDFTAKLVDVHPDGSAYNLGDGILRSRFAPSRVPTEIQINLWPTSNVFFPGHRIRLEISSSNFPRYDRNPNTGEFIPLATRTVVAKQQVFHSSLHPSRLILPLIDGNQP